MLFESLWTSYMYFNTSSLNLKENKRNLQIIGKSYSYVAYKTVGPAIGYSIDSHPFLWHLVSSLYE